MMQDCQGRKKVAAGSAPAAGASDGNARPDAANCKTAAWLWPRIPDCTRDGGYWDPAWSRTEPQSHEGSEHGSVYGGLLSGHKSQQQCPRGCGQLLDEWPAVLQLHVCRHTEGASLLHQFRYRLQDGEENLNGDPMPAKPLLFNSQP
ncbi:hypothetical protein NDU88_001280 [Pleurodeles waltl]|uniref:C2H2-type domain-containing protein n=1 Tax=Pleurodeles waltl TaxID=8319 RepID=A0AAV7S9C7_PLEWA|nr:hypothetical protein NDU88_001280 [Pleurodeles waltl]